MTREEWIDICVSNIKEVQSVDLALLRLWVRQEIIVDKEQVYIIDTEFNKRKRRKK